MTLWSHRDPALILIVGCVWQGDSLLAAPAANIQMFSPVRASMSRAPTSPGFFLDLHTDPWCPMLEHFSQVWLNALHFSLCTLGGGLFP